MNNLIDNKHMQLAGRLADLLASLKFSLVTAESCTGGWIAHILTSLPTSSTWFERGFVTYSDDSKIDLLNINENTLKEHGPVSKEIAVAMAKGAIENSRAQVSLAVTGLAGPDSDEKSCVPIGTCWFAWSIKNQYIHQYCEQFQGDRITINFKAMERALSGLITILKDYSTDKQYG